MKHIVGVADMKVSACRGDLLVTYALGSCLGIAIFDAVAGVGGLLHVMLPSSSIDRAACRENPYRFVDTGVPRLFHEAYRLGASKDRLVVKVAGGAAWRGSDAADLFQIGRRNCEMLAKILRTNGVRIAADAVGGSASRTMTLDTETGDVLIRAHGFVTRL